MLKRVFVFGFLLATVACSGSSNPTPTNPSPTVSSVSITGNPSLNGGNLTSQMIARATLSNGTLQDVSTLAAWSSLNPAVATVSAIGLVTAVTVGTTTISATYQGKTGTLSISVLSLNAAAGLVGSCAGISTAGAMGPVTAQVNGVAMPFCLGSARQGSSAGETSIEAQSVTSPFFSLLITLPGNFGR
jgi:Bacterial Ig-like domain (group 2)